MYPFFFDRFFSLPGRRRALATLIAPLAAVLSACVPDENGGGQRRDSNSPPPAPGADAPVPAQLVGMTGTHVKLVWARGVGGHTDLFCNGNEMQLWGLDTDDPRGIRQIVAETGSFYRPMVTPDGRGIVFTKKNGRKKGNQWHFDPSIWWVDWEGKSERRIGSGNAVDVWQDPKTKEVWVYATDLLPTVHASMEGSRIERFLLESPEKREPVWDDSKVGTDNLQLSGDGTVMSCLFPWPKVGLINLRKGSKRIYDNGCWPSVAPDASRLMWVFDGQHENLRMFADGGDKKWKVRISDAPGANGHEMYHPRWSNHPRYFAVTGPYTGKTVGTSGGGEVEIYAGRFDERFRSVEAWVKVTDDGRGDFYPDLWLDEKQVGRDDPVFRTGATADDDDNEPADPKQRGPWGPALPVLFAWENRQSENLEGSREMSVTPRERARFGPHDEMLTDGGHFDADAPSQSLTAGHLGTEGKSFTIAIAARLDRGDATGAALQAGRFALGIAGGQWEFRDGHRTTPLGPAKEGEWTHWVLTGNAEGLVSAQKNGDPFIVPARPKVSVSERSEGGGLLRFGNGWPGAIEAVTILGAIAPEAERREAWLRWKQKRDARPEIPRFHVKGELVEVTETRPVEALDTYAGGLIAYRYKVLASSGGPAPGDHVVVLHWFIMDRRELSGFPRKIGGHFDLDIEPGASHPEIESERQWNDLLDLAEPYLDVATPRP